MDNEKSTDIRTKQQTHTNKQTVKINEHSIYYLYNDKIILKNITAIYLNGVDLKITQNGKTIIF